MPELLFDHLPQLAQEAFAAFPRHFVQDSHQTSISLRSSTKIRHQDAAASAGIDIRPVPINQRIFGQ
ncbi:hypothetical protein CQ10_30095 [Bradyrhizobium valentinum]|uniref:Uncharacterized protein n=1 Tax=Bradyrhizobium valentinum TaxID=1518501 RepID=A0A0R3KT98_9BRAD|nr:hypothetical protein CQ10_30095 [Bradyrhizobium valentinum]KRQ97743.1 hypothetical protein CP49_17960 [Bradyrhizobium valentinum]